MKKFHVHVGVRDLKPSIGFYSALFGEDPIKEKPDYAKWEPKDTNLIFAISTRAKTVGVDHVGIRVDSPEEIKLIADRLKAAELKVYDEGETTCCYAKSNKAWAKDPSGLAWETYQNMEDAEIFHETSESLESESACCSPSDIPKKSGGCC